MRTILAILFSVLACQVGYAQRIITKGATDQTVYVSIIDSALGTPETGVTSATSGIDLEYTRNGAAPTNLTESDLAATDSAHSDGGIKHIGGGIYRVDLPDAAVASGVNSVYVGGTITDMIVIGCDVQLTGLDLQDGTPPADVTTWNGTAVATPDTAGYPKVTLKVGSGTGEVALNVGTVSIGDVVDGTITAADFAAGAIDANAIAASAIGASEIATDAIGAAEVAASALAYGTEITGTFAANMTQLGGNATGVTNMTEMFITDWATGYDGTANMLNVDIALVDGAATGTSLMDAADIRTALGLAAANLDTQLSAIDDYVDTEVAAILDDTGTSGVQIPANEISAASTSADFLTEINGEVLDVLNVDTFAEPGQGTPAATTSLAAKINYLYKFARNKKDASSAEVKYYNDDATTVDHKASVNTTGGVTTVGEVATGP